MGQNSMHEYEYLGAEVGRESASSSLTASHTRERREELY
jgi:hypothetical protein